MSEMLSAVVVSYADPGATAAAVRSLLAQSLPIQEILVVDNDPAGTAARELAAHERLQVVCPGCNLGYAAAANLAARRVHGEWIFFLNPDARAAPDCLARLLAAVDGADVAIVGAQVLLPDGRTNAGENPIHLSGICWSGRYGRERELGPDRDVASVSGAALLARRSAYLELGGMCPHFFMYYDDVDLAWRARLTGRRVRFCPSATVIHEYEFHKGSQKWFYLERNRLWALASNLRPRTIVLLAPLLAATEASVCRRAFSDHWLRSKLLAWASLLTQLPQLFSWRRSVQLARSVSDYGVMRLFVAELDTPALASGQARWANPLLRCYSELLMRIMKREARRFP